MLIQSAAELLGEAERLAAEGGDATEVAPAAANGAAAAAGEGLQGAAGQEGEEEAEEAAMTPLQTAQHFAMRNLMNAGEREALCVLVWGRQAAACGGVGRAVLLSSRHRPK